MEIAQSKVSEWIKLKKEFNFLDVRRDDEREIASLGGIHIPLHDLEKRFEELPRDKKPLIVYCHHGVRSMQVARFLASNGFEQVVNIDGGIDAWSIDKDSSIARY